MAITCGVCLHPNRKNIERDILDGVPLRAIAERAALSHTTVHDHKKNHLPAKLVKAREIAEIIQADSLLDRLRNLTAEAEDVLNAAKRTRKHTLRLQAIREIQRLMEFEAKLLGQLQEHTVTNIYVNPQWVEIRTVILTALSDHPDARQAVVAALAEVSDASRE